MSPAPPRFRALVLDVDSTLCGIEGIDFLAGRRGAEMGARIAEVTERAMHGAIPLESVYGERLRLIRPTRDDLAALAGAYRASLADGAAGAIATMRAARVRIVLVSGGIREAILPVARELGFADDELVAVSVVCDGDGGYVGFDTVSPLVTQRGKVVVVRGLIEQKRLPRPVLAVGDGATDVAMRDAADAFAAYTGFASRQPVVDAADFTLGSFDEVARVVLGTDLA